MFNVRINNRVQIIVAGNTPVYSIAVATGDHSFQDLKKLGADLVVENFCNYNKVIKAVKELAKNNK